jgi:S-adenosylmethionine hydrolase
VTRPVITLTTDFGEESYYPGALRGVLLSRCPDAILADITHHAPSFSPLAGAFVLSQACPRFPEGTVHLAVIDPGVGGTRRGLLVASGGHRFVGPDNGLFTPFLDGARVYALPDGGEAASPTFHGRDLFAPAAARLAGGEDPAELGVPVSDPVRLPFPRPSRAGSDIRGEVLLVDRFGNLVTSIRAEDMEPATGPALLARVNGRRIGGLSRTYADAPPGTLILLIGSSGHLEVAVVQGNAAERLGARCGDRIVVGP